MKNKFIKYFVAYAIPYAIAIGLWEYFDEGVIDFNKLAFTSCFFGLVMAIIMPRVESSKKDDSSGS